MDADDPGQGGTKAHYASLQGRLLDRRHGEGSETGSALGPGTSNPTVSQLAPRPSGPKVPGRPKPATATLVATADDGIPKARSRENSSPFAAGRARSTILPAAPASTSAPAANANLPPAPKTVFSCRRPTESRLGRTSGFTFLGRLSWRRQCSSSRLNQDRKIRAQGRIHLGTDQFRATG